MNSSAAAVVRHSRRFDVENAPAAAVSADARRIAFTTSGRRHGPITRLVSPSDIGELIKPFVLLDYAEVAPRPEPLFGIHPHSGIATLTVVLRGGMAYEDTTGKSGSVPTGGLEWMKAGNGVWHDGGPTPGEPLRAFQLWVALPPSEENAPPESQYIAPDAVQEEGPVRVILEATVWPAARFVPPQASTISTSASTTGSAGATRRQMDTASLGSLSTKAACGHARRSVQGSSPFSKNPAPPSSLRRRVTRRSSWIRDQAPTPARAGLLLGPYERSRARSRRGGDQSNWPAASRRGSSVNINHLPLKDKEQRCHPAARN